VLIGTGLIIGYAMGILNWMGWLLAFIGMNANSVHKWSHRTRAENGRVISTVQRLGIIQSPSQHAMHHRRTKDSNYCVLTNFVNPVLEFIHFWRGLELAIYAVLRIRKRVDESVAGTAQTQPVPVCNNPSCRAPLLASRASA
jgi:hypothetical protein